MHFGFPARFWFFSALSHAQYQPVRNICPLLVHTKAEFWVQLSKSLNMQDFGWSPLGLFSHSSGHWSSWLLIPSDLSFRISLPILFEPLALWLLIALQYRDIADFYEIPHKHHWIQKSIKHLHPPIAHTPLKSYLQKYAVEIAVFFNIVENVINHNWADAQPPIW